MRVSSIHCLAAKSSRLMLAGCLCYLLQDRLQMRRRFPFLALIPALAVADMANAA